MVQDNLWDVNRADTVEGDNGTSDLVSLANWLRVLSEQEMKRLWQ